MAGTVIILDEEENHYTPIPSSSKKPKTQAEAMATIIVLDDDLTPQKSEPVPFSLASPSLVPETPMSDFSISKCTKIPENHEMIVSELENQPSESGKYVYLASESDPDSSNGMKKPEENQGKGGRDDKMETWSSRFNVSEFSTGDSNPIEASRDRTCRPSLLQDDIEQVHDDPDKENFSLEQINAVGQQKIRKTKSNKCNVAEKVARKKMTMEERDHIREEKKIRKEKEKFDKAALKIREAELKKLEKEKEKWEKGQFALKSIIAEFDTKVIEMGSIGGHLLSRFAEKGLQYRIISNQFERSILWRMSAPDHIIQLLPKGIEVQYILFVYDAEEFCSLIMNNSILDQISKVRSCHPSYTICFITNRLMAYVNKREKEQYKNPSKDTRWRRPPIEEMLAKITTHFASVHYRQCTDEAELAEHVVGLTCSLASCQFRKKLTQLSVNANGCLIPKDSLDKSLIKKNLWLKALIAIPKVQSRFAIAIWKKYPTMRSLLNVYMDPDKPVLEKEFLLEDLLTEGLTGSERRLGQMCSKRVYRVLMAQSEGMLTADVEEGADFFMNHS